MFGSDKNCWLVQDFRIPKVNHTSSENSRMNDIENLSDTIIFSLKRILLWQKVSLKFATLLKKFDLSF